MSLFISSDILALKSALSKYIILPVTAFWLGMKEGGGLFCGMFPFFFQSSWVLIIKVIVLQAAYTCGFFLFFYAGFHSVFNWNFNLLINVISDMFRFR